MYFLNYHLTRDLGMLRVGYGVGGGPYPSANPAFSQGIHFCQNVVSCCKVGNKHIVSMHLDMS